ncbi:MAG: AraC family transcriptional regulator [Eubacterium sp.]|nr:AraC family transcriptional regulator [Eubacterium sp.]SEG02331.1 AraC-type DNA-binding protein [Eubacterium ruminantium]
MARIDDELTKGLFDKRENDVKHPGYEMEMRFYNLVAEGRIKEMMELRKNVPPSNAKERGVLSEDPLRNSMYHMVAMTTLISRSCIAHGMEPEFAYEMSDIYIRRADKAKTLKELNEVREEMISDYAHVMEKRNKQNVRSTQIILCLDYIHDHLHDNISIAELAEHVKLNETYLSKLFKKEMECSIGEHIRRMKVEEAKNLLRYSDMTSIEIATDLGFTSHSYFISVFKKETGMTPREYRNENFRKV